MNSENAEIAKQIGYIKAKGFTVHYGRKTTLIRRDIMVEKKGKNWVCFKVDLETGIVDSTPHQKSEVLLALLKKVI